MTITFNDCESGIDAVEEALRKMVRVNDELLQRSLSDSTRGILANLGTCLACYLHQLNAEQNAAVPK